MRNAIVFLFFLPIFMWGQTTVTICNGDSVLLYNNWETQNGIYTNGITSTTLIVNPTPTLTGSFILNGNATQPIANTYQLTQATGNQSGSAWNSVTLNLTQPFNFDVDVFLGYNNGGADGLAFLLQQVSTSVGTSGGGLGYQGISPSFAVEFDTWQNSSDPSYDHIAIQKNGDLNHNGGNNLAGPLGFPPANINIEDGLWHNVVFSWDPATFNFKVVFDGILLVNYTNNIMANIFNNNPNVYWGFTAATGGANNVQQFRVNSLGVQLSDITICHYDTVQIDPQINTSLYSYLWTPNYNISNNTASSPLFSPDTTTTYFLEITNSYGCSNVDSLTVNVDTFSSSIIFPFASQFCLGIPPINLNSATPIGGNYLVNNNASTIFNPTINDIGVNTITYSYTSSNGCSNSLTNNITVYDSPSVLCVSTNVSCNGLTDGSATLTISGGTPSYTTNWGGSNPTALSAGSYGYTITDINSCTFSDSIIIYEPGIFTASVNTTNVSCNGANNGTASIQVQGSSAPPGTISTLSYCTSTPGSNQNSTIENIQLTGDIFSINNNTTGICDQYEDYTNQYYADITEGQSYTIDVDLGDCSNNYSSGGKVYIDWNIDGDFNDPGEEVGTIPIGLPSTTTIPFTVPFSGVFGATRMRIVSQFLNGGILANSIGPCDIGVMANPVYIQPWFGATEDYSIVINSATITATYLWNTLATSDSIFNLTAGIYSVDITDGNGCTITDIMTITEPTAISVIPTISDINCFDGSDGGIELNIAGGTPDYTVSAPPFSQILAGGASYFSTSNVLSAGNYSYTITDSSNCTYSGNITLINPNPSTSITLVTSCDSYSWNGNTYFSSGIQTDTLINQNNCDSILTLNLTITNSSLSSTSINECDSYLWNGTTYTTSGLYDSLFTNSANCDSIASLNLTINYSSSSVLSNTSCDSYLWGITNQNYINSGIYTQISTNSVGCTHIDSLILNINNSAISSTALSSCDSYLWNSNNYLISGLYTDTLTTSLGCDSVATLNLTITDTTSTLIAINSCDSFTWIANGQTYFSSIIDTLLSTNANGCPNVDSLILNVNYNNSSIDSQVACDTYQWIDGNTYTTSSNSATFLTTNTNGCDSLISLNIIINSSTSSFLSDNNCISYQWPLNNQTYTNSGIYTYLSVNAAGCTNTDTLSLTINNPNTGTGSINACFFYNWNGNTYSTSGIYTDTLSNIFGCDSIATLNLTISDTSYQMVAETECISYLWPVTNIVYTNSGTYIQASFNANGCTHIDSLILIINNPTASYDTVSICDSYYWNGITFNFSGDYNFNLINSAGCDSVANLNLTISNSTSSSLSISKCDSYSWEGINYNMSGTYMRTLNTINGCDSIVTLNLIIVSGGFEITTNINITDVDCFGMNNGAINLYPSGGINPLTFSWDNGATTQNINSLIAGNYSFTITDSIGCTLDSAVSLSEPDKLIASFQANNEICRNDSISILIELTNPNYNYYIVQFNDSIQKSFIIDSSGVLIPEGIPFYIIPNFSNQIQLISVTDNNGCTSNINQPLDIIVNEFPILEINQDDICVGTPSFILNEGTPEGGDYFIDGQNTNFFDVENLENGAYTIRYEYTDILTNCSNSIEKIININSNPIADFSFSPQPADIDNPNILFINESENIENTKWSLGDGTNITDELEFWHTYADTGTYDVIYAVRNQFNCSDTAKATLIINPVYQIFIPSAFTPNNDGHNDNFKLEIIGQKEYTMTIFDRWGEIIFQEKNGIWDGKINNQIVQNGTYSYTISVTDFKNKAFIYTGIVTLIK